MMLEYHSQKLYFSNGSEEKSPEASGLDFSGATNLLKSWAVLNIYGNVNILGSRMRLILVEERCDIDAYVEVGTHMRTKQFANSLR